MKLLLVVFFVSLCIPLSAIAQESLQFRTAFMRVCKWNKSTSDWEGWGDAIKNDNLVVLKSNASSKNVERIIFYSEPKQALNITGMHQIESEEPYGVKNSIGFEGNAVDQDGDECEVVVILEKSPKRVQLFITYKRLAMVSYVLHPIE